MLLRYVGKGIWLHVECSLQLRTSHENSDNNAGVSTDGLVSRAAETSGIMNEKEIDDLTEVALPVSAEGQQVKTEPELVTDFGRQGKELEGDVTRSHPLNVQEAKVKDALDTTPSPLMMTGPCNVSMPRRAMAQSVFSYG